jgi:hypothetical protein
MSWSNLRVSREVLRRCYLSAVAGAFSLIQKSDFVENYLGNLPEMLKGELPASVAQRVLFNPLYMRHRRLILYSIACVVMPTRCGQEKPIHLSATAVALEWDVVWGLARPSVSV